MQGLAICPKAFFTGRIIGLRKPDLINLDGFVKSQKAPIFVIASEAKQSLCCRVLRPDRLDGWQVSWTCRHLKSPHR